MVLKYKTIYKMEFKNNTKQKRKYKLKNNVNIDYFIFIFIIYIIKQIYQQQTMLYIRTTLNKGNNNKIH